MKLFIIFVVGLLNGFHTASDPVYYARVTNTRTYMSSDRVTVTECWFTKDKMCSLRNQLKIIVRNDLGVLYTVNLNSGSYRIDSIKGPKKEIIAKTVDFKYVGQFYEPEFEWRQPQQLTPDTIGDYICNRYMSEGDADFDQISLEFSLAKTDNELMAEWLNSQVLNLSAQNNKREPVIAILKSDKSLVPLRIIETVENAIAPFIRTKTEVDKLGLASNAEGVFDIPENFKKVN
jgi:hypothetical protein